MTNKTSIFSRSCLTIAFLTLSLLPASLFAQTDALAKQPTETWQQFMVRMNQAGQIDANQLKLWQSGQALTIPQVAAVTRTRQETRTRTVPVQRTRTEERDDGTTVNVPYTENVTQNYTVSIPYTEQVVNTVTVPAPGTLPGNAAFDGFVRETPAQTFSAPQLLPKPPSTEEFQQSTMKKSSENWPAYIARLQSAKVLNASQVARWKKGQAIEVSTNIPFQRMRSETRTRQVPVTRMRTETQQNGEETYQVQVPYTENVTQQYQVQVPYTEMKKVSISIPASSAVAANATTSGVSFGSRSRSSSSFAKTNSRNNKKRAAKDKRSKKKASKDVVALMKIRPLQSNAQYDQPDDLGGLRVSNSTKDGSKIQEVKSSKGQTLRQFIDTDGDGEIDHWVYFSNGQQSYCEQDLDGDGKVDQYQYRTGGVVKNGIDEDQDGKIDIWDNGG